MTRILTPILFACFAAAPAVAMEDMTCADFTAMSLDEQTETVSMMTEGMVSEGGMMAEGMAEGGMMAEEATGEGGMAGGGMMAGEAMAAEDAARRVASACEEHPEMMLGEAMQE
jgi:hypothetical protein